MKKTIVVTIIIFVSVMLNCALSTNVKHISADFYDKGRDDYEYELICEIDKILDTKQYDGTGTNIPYTFYKAKVLENYRTYVENEIVIKFYGGVDTDGNVILFEGMQPLVVGEKYIIFADKSRAFDGRYFDNALVVSCPQQYCKLNENASANIVSYSVYRPIDETIIGGGGGNANIDFDSSISLSIGKTIKINYTNVIRNRYYKFSVDEKQYVSIYTTGEFDSQLKLYNSNRECIFSNDDVDNDHGLTLTSAQNSFINYLIEPNQTYYFSVSSNIFNSTDTILVKLISDNWTWSDVGELALPLSGLGTVDLGDFETQFNNHSKYVEEINFSVGEWNSLGHVKIYEDNMSTLPNFAIYDFNDPDSSAMAITYPLAVYNGVFLNDHHFQYMKKMERVKTIMHELGHILGLDEFTGKEDDINIMVQGRKSYTAFGPADLAVYYYLWRI